ncbi:MAG: MmgE/PrpD family protein [Pseudomonadota bacterium]
MAGNPVEAYGRWIANKENAWPEEALASAHREFIDLVAVMLPGAMEPATRIVHEVVSPWGEGPAHVVGQPRTLAAPWAALVNGTAGHALDFDDNFDPPKAHATTVLAPAILALGEQEGASGGACLDAYIVGLQIMGRVGQGVNPAHRNRGWHATATVGAVGAAAACARLLGLDAVKAAYALSISTSMAAGFMAQFGTMTKPVHAGLAAKAGVLAASLARAGLTASMDVLDGRTGMNRLMVGPDYEALRDSLSHVEHGQNLRFETARVGEPLLILEHGFRVKRFANCGAAHRAMDGLLDLRARHGFGAADVARIEVFAPRVHFNNLMYSDPQDGLEAKFSMEYALALCLAEGACQLRDFTDEGVRRPHLRALFPLIHRRPVDQLEGEFPTRVEVVLKDGARFTATMAMPLGSKAAPFSDAQYWEKFAACAQGVVDAARTARLRAALERLPALGTIAELMRHLAWQP